MESLRPVTSNDNNFDSSGLIRENYDDDDDDDDEVRAWREVHGTLLTAVQAAQEAIAVQKAQRRYWLEEIAYNLDDSGQPATHSTWKRPIRVRTDTKGMKRKKSTTTTTDGASQPKTQKGTKSQSSKSKEKSSVDPDGSTTTSTSAMNDKKRRKKNDADDDPVKGNEKEKRTKLVMNRSTGRSSSIEQQAPPSKSKFSTIASTSPSSSCSEEYLKEEEEGIDDDGDDNVTDFADLSEYSTTATSLQHRQDIIPTIQQDQYHYQQQQHSSISIPYNKNQNSDSSNHPNWTHDIVDDDPTGRHQHAGGRVHPYTTAQYHNNIMNNECDVDDFDDDDEETDTDGMQQPPPDVAPSISTAAVLSHSLHSTTMIRNYTSLQDIAMNDNDSDEEDRF